MVAWLVWESVYDYNYLARIFLNKEDAEKYCEQMNREAREGKEDISYYVARWLVY